MRTVRRGLAACLAGLAVVVAGSSMAGNGTPDPWITVQTKIALLTSNDIDGMDINVDTMRGLVTLHGTVDSETEKANAEALARKTSGVADVRNLLQVEPNKKKASLQKKDDAITKENVGQALEADASLRDSSVGVASVNDGVVLLSGKAATISDQLRAIELARWTDGVRKVASEIEGPNELYDVEMWTDADIHAGGNGAANDGDVPDGWITMKTKMRLMANDRTPALDINVDTREGIVTLFGIVENEKTKREAEAEALKVGGVKDVRNLLQVVTAKKQERVEIKDTELEESIEAALREWRELGDVEVEVRNGHAHVTGTVHTPMDRYTAGVLARSTPGVRAVTNDLAIKRGA